MKLPFILRLERKPRLRRAVDPWRRPCWECSGRGVTMRGTYDFDAWAVWFAAVFPGPHGDVVLRLAEEEHQRRRQEENGAFVADFCGMQAELKPLKLRRWDGDVKAIADAFDAGFEDARRLVAEATQRAALDGTAAVRVTATGDGIRMDLMEDFRRASLGPQK